MCVLVKDGARDRTQTKRSASPALCSAANPRCCINSAINAKVSSHPRPCGDAALHIYATCTMLKTPCGFNHIINVFHLVKWSSAERLSLLSIIPGGAFDLVQ